MIDNININNINDNYITNEYDLFNTLTNSFINLNPNDIIMNIYNNQDFH